MHTPPKFDSSNSLTSEEVREVDRVAVEEYDLQVIQMMELAAFQMARLVRSKEGELSGKKVLVLAGKGNNGGDAIACARFLQNFGAEVLIESPKDLNDIAKHHILAAKRLGISVRQPGDFFYQSEVVIDGLLGYSIQGQVRSPYVQQIQSIPKGISKVYSFDIPSGLDPDDGSVHGVAVRANTTLTLAYPKKGLFMDRASKHVGELYLADIGIPEGVYDKVRDKFPQLKYENPFEKSSLIRINE